MNAPMSANSMMPGRQRVHLVLRDAEEGAGEVDIVAAGQVHLEAGPEGQQGGDPPMGDDLALARLQDPGQRQEQRALAGAIRAR